MKEIINLFRENKKQLCFVGGYCRDKLLGKESNDIDFATDTTPEQMIDIFTKYRKGGSKDIDIWYSGNGKAHGTIVFREDNVDYEITTFRKDVSTDGRNATVEWAKTIEEDLARRDFTMNAIAKCAYTNKIIDPFNGQQDIENKVIRFVGDAEKRVHEDHLRLIRGYRFLSQLGKGWKFIDGNKFNSDYWKFLNKLSKERVRDELIKIFKYNPCFSLYHMPSWLIGFLTSSINMKKYKMQFFHGHFHAEDIDQHLMITLATSCRLTDKPLLRLACFLHDIGKCMESELNEWGYPTFIHHDTVGADAVEQWMKDMKFSKADTHYVSQLVRHHMVDYNMMLHTTSNRTIRRYVVRLGEELLDDMILLNYCDRTANLANTKLCSYQEYLIGYTIKPRWLEIKAKDNCFKVTDLKISGNDLKELGVPEGKEIGRILKALFVMVEEETLENDKVKLLVEVMKIK